MKYLVTGGAGFIGSNFIVRMLFRYPDLHIVNLDALTYAGNLENLKAVAGNPRYTFIKGNICDTELVKRIFEEQNIDAVINFAAESHVDNSISDPDMFVKTNVNGTVNLLNIARRAWSINDNEYLPGVKFIQVSTDEVYGSLGNDGYFTEKTPLDPHSPYSASKAAADMFVKAYADTFKLPVNITRCSNNYGPYQFPEKLIPLMIHNALNHIPLPVYGDGQQVRDWLYVDDHCAAIELVLREGVLGEIYNIGGHNEKINLDIVKIILNYIHENVDETVNEGLIKHVTDRKGHDRRYAIDPEKIQQELGWYPETAFEDGIIKTIKWYTENKSWMENCKNE